MAQSSRGRSVVAATSLLVLGAVLGIGADRHLHGGASSSGNSLLTPHEALEELDRAANLRPAQRERIDSILDAHQTDVDAAWRTAQDHVGRTVQVVISDIEAILDPDQIAPFRALVERVHNQESSHFRH